MPGKQGKKGWGIWGKKEAKTGWKIKVAKGTVPRGEIQKVSGRVGFRKEGRSDVLFGARQAVSKRVGLIKYLDGRGVRPENIKRFREIMEKHDKELKFLWKMGRMPQINADTNPYEFEEMAKREYFDAKKEEKENPTLTQKIRGRLAKEEKEETEEGKAKYGATSPAYMGPSTSEPIIKLMIILIVLGAIFAVISTMFH